jgi:hypothetical protein
MEDDTMSSGRNYEKNGLDISSTDNEGIERRDLLLGGGALLAASVVAGGAMITSEPASAQIATIATAPKMKMTTDIPADITTPNSVETRLGTLKFTDGFPDDKTTQVLYDNLDFMRGVQAFLVGLSGASVQGFLPAAKKFGGVDGNVMIFEQLMDSKALWLTPNNSSVYFFTWLDTTKGPIVMETPPNVLGIFDDHWFRWVGDYGNAGPDKGQGGKFLILPPDYKGDVPGGYFVMRPRTYGVWAPGRGMLVDGDPKPAVESLKKLLKIYPLAQAANPPVTKFTNMSGIPHNTIHSNDFGFYEEIHAVLQMEPNEALDSETLGIFASIGLEKGKPFAPDARMKKILTEAAAVGNATARTLSFRSRTAAAYIYPGGSWWIPSNSGYEFESQPGVADLDSRIGMFYWATGVTPAMFAKMIGRGSQYAGAFTDGSRQGLDGSKAYKVRLPPKIPMKDNWSFTVYDNQTRSCLQTDQQFPSVNSFDKGVVTNPDGTTDVWFGPTLPKGAPEANWVQTIPGKGWNVLFRLYGPTEAWFDQTWRVGEIELVK